MFSFYVAFVFVAFFMDAFACAKFHFRISILLDIFRHWSMCLLLDSFSIICEIISHCESYYFEMAPLETFLAKPPH